MTMILQNQAELLELGLTKIFDRTIAKQKDYVGEFFNVQSTKKLYNTSLGMGEMGLMQSWVAAGRQVPYEDIDKGFKKVYTQEKYALGFVVEEDLLRFDLYNEIAKKPRKLARAVHNTKQYHGMSVFGNAFNGGFLGPDSKPLCSATHPVAPDSGTTFSNTYAVALNADNLETMRTNAYTWTDDKGNLIQPNFDTLIVSPTNRQAARVVAETDEKPDVTDHGINVWKGALNVVEVPLLTKWNTNYWFFVDSERMKDYLEWYEAQTPTLERDKEDFNKETLAFKTIGWWAYGWSDASWIMGSTGA